MSSASSTALGTGIASDPKLHKGEPVIAGTSTSVRAVVELWNQGMMAEQIPMHLPHLHLAQVFEALHYYLGHRDEIDRYIAANRIPEDWAGKRFTFAPVIEQLRPTIFQICLSAWDLSPSLRKQVGRPFINSVLGTGFLIDRDGHAITALHVLTEGERAIATIDAAKKEIKAGLAQPNTENMRGNFTQVRVSVLARDPRHDLALLKLDPNPFSGVRSGIVIDGNEIPMVFDAVRFNTRRPRDGEFVLTSGYPLNTSVLVSNSGIVASSWSFDIAEMPLADAPLGFAMPDVGDVYLADIEVNPGNSGGPVYLPCDASTIGVCVASQLAPVRAKHGKPYTTNGETLYYSSGLTVVVPSRYVVELAEAHDVTLQAHGGT